MALDLSLSALHFLLAFALAAILAAEAILLRPGITAHSLRLAANLDRIYGASAMALLVVGFARVFLGAKGSEFYLSNPVFWTKIALFAGVAVLSIAPTIRFIRWSRQAQRQPGFLPAEGELRAIRRWLHGQAALFALIPIAAAFMARGIGIR